MWYEITGIDLVYRKPETDASNPEGPSAVCTVKIVQDGEARSETVTLNSADLRQLENLLRGKIDKVLNGEDR